MGMNTEEDEIFIKIKGIGFVFLIDKRMKYNLISPALMSFFHPAKKGASDPDYMDFVNSLNIQVDSINLDDIFHYIGKEIGKCEDNKLRLCKVFMLKFEHEECTFSFPFLLDKSLSVPAILGFDSYNKLRKKVKKQ